jgi:uncharacterized protein (TIGR00255 family)
MGALRSMTGFGTAASEAVGLDVRVEVRAVNHRGLQVKSRLSSEFAALETEVDAVVRSQLARGSVTVQVNVERTVADGRGMLDVDAARRWDDALRGLAIELGIEARVDLSMLVALPGVIATGAAGNGAQDEGEVRAILDTVRSALVSLDEMRRREGAALARDLLDNGSEIERLVELVRARMPAAVRTHHETLRQRVSELVGDNVPAADLAREAALLADRMDVGEELTRLVSHLHQLRTFVAEGGPVGRKLDFLVQEFLREANTTGAKCNDAHVAHLVVDLKTHIERLREQVQNIE